MGVARECEQGALERLRRGLCGVAADLGPGWPEKIRLATPHPEGEPALGGNVELSFVPHSAPIARGIHATAFMSLADGVSSDQVAQAFERSYGDEPFVRLVPNTPEVRHVAGTNVADVGWAVDDDAVCAMVAIDNLGKGMAGTAVQNMNLMFGLDERAGLNVAGGGL